MIVFFACRSSRTGDIPVLRLGVGAAGHDFRLMLLPWAYPLLALAACARLFGVRMHLIISDKFIGDTLLARLFGRHCTRMLWNYADEWPEATTRLPLHQVCFFSEDGGPRQVDLFRFAPQPAPVETPARALPRREIVFVGDVTRELPVPHGAAWWEQRFVELCQRQGYGFYLGGEYRELLARELPDLAARRLVKVLAKNLLRLYIVEAARREFGERLVLLGSNWRRLGLASEPSAYSIDVRIAYYRSAVVNLDCGSKSGDSALYPRTSELISYAGGLLQVGCVDSAALFGERMSDFSFSDPSMLLSVLERRLVEPAAMRMERDEWLASRLRVEGLLMQHSVDAMLKRATSAARQ